MTGSGDHHQETANDPNVSDTSGVPNFVDEGGPLEPADVAEVEGTEVPSAPADGQEAALSDVDRLTSELAERTNDLQRLQAEFLNYKRRVERDRELIQENAKFAALSGVVEVLDTIDRAKEQGELDPGLKAVSDQLETVVTNAGLSMFGEVGEPFDPTLHEALAHQGEAEGIEVPSIAAVARSGIRIGDRVVRAAQVLVHGPQA